jgi:hypothetical protein
MAKTTDVQDAPLAGADLLADKIAQAVAQATLSVQQRVRPIENLNPPVVTWNNPTGRTDRPKLRRETYFCGAAQTETQLSDQEIELFNQIAVPGRYHNRRWEVTIRDAGGSDEVLEIRVPVQGVDDKAALPHSLTALLREILDEAAAKAKE